jgi:hypothetical protein
MRKATSESCRISLSVSWDTGRIYRTDRDPGRPAPVFGPADEAVVDGVLDDVLESGVVLFIGLDQRRPVAPAEKVVLPSVPFVEGSRVGPVQVPHALVEVGQGRLDEQVVVVPHQAPDVHPPPVAPLDSPQNVDEDDPVVVVEHDRPVVVPACPDVVGGAGEDDAMRPSHPAKLAAAEPVFGPRERFGPRLSQTRHVPGTRPGRRRRGREGLSVSD